MEVKHNLRKTVCYTSSVLFFDRSHNAITIQATRTRIKDGNPSIEVRFGPQHIVFTDSLGSDYELAAREFARVLLAACNHPCLLPSNTEADS